MNLLLTGAFSYSQHQCDRLANLGYKLSFIQYEDQEFSHDPSTFDAVVCNALFQHIAIAEFKSLKFVQLTSAGLDRVPLSYIQEKGIWLKNAGNVYAVPIAEWIVCKILEICKGSRRFYKSQAERTWQKRRDIIELTDMKVSIVGFGNIGTEVAKRLRSFGLEILAIDSVPLSDEQKPLQDRYFTPNNADEALAISDIVVLTLPLSDETRHFIDKRRISLMKPNSILVNASRGAIIDEAALVEALGQGKFHGVALDVFEREPLPPDDPLWIDEHVIVTPHIAFISDKANDRLFELIAANLGDFIKNKGTRQ